MRVTVYLSSSLPSRLTSLSLSLEPFDLNPSLTWALDPNPSLERAESHQQHPVVHPSTTRPRHRHNTSVETHGSCASSSSIIVAVERTFNKVCTYVRPLPISLSSSRTIVAGVRLDRTARPHGTAAGMARQRSRPLRIRSIYPRRRNSSREDGSGARSGCAGPRVRGWGSGLRWLA